MKNRIQIRQAFIIAILFLPMIFENHASAQNHPFPTEDAVWVNRYQSYYHQDGWFTVTQEEVDNFCANGLDTSINNVAYKQLDLCTANSSDYFAAIRYTVGQVYIIPKDSTAELLVYDFTLNEGDSKDVYTKSSWPGENLFTMHTITIDNIDTIMVDGSLRKVFNIQNVTYPYIEGIGSRSGLFMEANGNISNYFVDLMCMSQQGVTHYSLDDGPLAQGIQGTCDLTLSVDEPQIAETPLKVYPNPNQGNFTLKNESEFEIDRVSLYNLYGQLISSQNMGYAPEVFFELQGAPGIYLLEVVQTDGNRMIQKIIKE
ncbi:hypothetical protein DNU06_04510 [Putridiphycobacter roseus]|uniref:Secretion system C-terminal sorting domain-containing protein n=1 Tax=Putridiphycobacter roseus TaxID=2219161 RepID=A0A2W1NIV3_9FLAO|nr:T9SS type A sorting domain-containing protein [Putridiphycobacter roseus]PZE17886.1 hypothetical protein DNU06_04510 [Putridiphycobacter roseus]